MTTFTIKINERTKAGKAFRAMTETFFKDVKGIEILETSTQTEDEIYNPEFVKMILERGEGINDPEKRKNWTTVNQNDIWGSIL